MSTLFMLILNNSIHKCFESDYLFEKEGTGVLFVVQCAVKSPFPALSIFGMCPPPAAEDLN